MARTATPEGRRGKKVSVEIHSPRPISPPIDIRLEIVYRSLSKKEAAMQGYCVKCRTKREIRNAKSITMKNGKPATQGVCPVCGTKIFRIGK